MEKDLHSFNAFLSEHRFGGMEAPRLQRIFNNGDDPDFNWNKGGRLYAVGPNNYQNMKSNERRKITIDGEATCEIDIGACHLTLLYGIFREPFDPSKDPYDVGGLDRDLVKKIIVTMIGRGGRLKRWPNGARKEFEERIGKCFPSLKAAEASELVIRHHPCLGELEAAALDWSNL